MAVVGGGEQDRGPTAGGDVLVDGAVVHLVAVGEAFGVAAGVVRESGDVIGESCGTALEDRVGGVAAADADFVRVLEFPLQGSGGAVDADVEAALSTGGDLRDGGVGVDVVGEPMLGLAETQEK